jgi:hypothetical protein
MYDSLGVSSNTSVDECDIVSTVAGPTIIVNLGVDGGKNVANAVDLVNGVHGTKKKKYNKKKKKKKMKDMMIASTPSTADVSLYMLLDSSLLVSVPYSTHHSVPSLPSLHQYTASNAMKAAKMKEKRINVCDEAAKEGTGNHECKVHSIIRKADEIYNPRLCTCMPYQGSYLILLLLVVLTREIKPLVPLLPKLVVLVCVLTPLVHCI